MKKMRSNLLVPLIVLITVISSYKLLNSEKKEHSYAGSKVCAGCHASDAIGNQYGKWLRTPHAQAVKTLKTGPALAIGKKLSIISPADDAKCLACHTTGGGSVQKTRDEGVGCEACHGAGSDYSEFIRHVNTINRQKAYETARRHGMHPIIGIKHIKRREKICLNCHNNARPCFPDDSREIYRQSISLQVVSDMRKGNLILKHQLIPPFPQY